MEASRDCMAARRMKSGTHPSRWRLDSLYGVLGLPDAWVVLGRTSSNTNTFALAYFMSDHCDCRRREAVRMMA
jgi:hypothetical protein